jgi:hypothetical protein
MSVGAQRYATALRQISISLLQNAATDTLVDEVVEQRAAVPLATSSLAAQPEEAPEPRVYARRLRTAAEIEARAFNAELSRDWASDAYTLRLSGLLSRSTHMRPLQSADSIYPFYSDAVRAGEKRVEDAVHAYWRNAVVALVAARIIADERKLLYKEPHTAKVVKALMLPAPGTLEGWGSMRSEERKPSKKDTPVLASDSEHDVQTLMAAMAQDLARAVGVAAPKPTQTESPLHALMEQLANAAAVSAEALDVALRSDYATLLHTLREQSLYEHEALVPEFSSQLNSVWRTMAEFYVDVLKRATTLDELRGELAREAVRRLEESSSVLERYRDNAPLLAPTITGAPRKRNLAVMMETAAGIELLKWQRALAPIVDNKMFAQRLPFLAELPLGVIAPAAVEAGDSVDRTHAAILRIVAEGHANTMRLLYNDARRRFEGPAAHQQIPAAAKLIVPPVAKAPPAIYDIPMLLPQEPASAPQQAPQHAPQQASPFQPQQASPFQPQPTSLFQPHHAPLLQPQQAPLFQPLLAAAAAAGRKQPTTGGSLTAAAATAATTATTKGRKK